MTPVATPMVMVTPAPLQEGVPTTVLAMLMAITMMAALAAISAMPLMTSALLTQSRDVQW